MSNICQIFVHVRIWIRDYLFSINMYLRVLQRLIPVRYGIKNISGEDIDYCLYSIQYFMFTNVSI
jgi:hypothetical protein